MKSYDCIIFDMDGTLYPNNNNCRTIYKDMAVNLILKYYDLDPQAAEARFLKLRDLEEQKAGQKVSNTLVLLNNFDKVEFDDVENEVERIYDVESVLRLDSRAVEAVTMVCRNYRTILYTMNNEKTTRRTLNVIGMGELFPDDSRYTFTTMAKLDLPRAERIQHVKPGIPGYELVTGSINCDPEKCLMIGDSFKSDIEPAKSLGMDGYHIKTFKDLYNLPLWLGLTDRPV
jgi:FMN phosphatase YigB (HAD superfamily)